MKFPSIIYFGAAALLLASCDNEAVEPQLTVSADRQTVKVGEPVTLTIHHNCQAGLCVFSGEQGHTFDYSAMNMLAGASEQDIREQSYRKPDPAVQPLVYDFSDATPGADVIGNGSVELLNAGGGYSLLNTEGQVVTLPSGAKALEINSTHPDWWYQALRFNLNSKIGSNTKLTLTMHFDHAQLNDIYSGAPSDNILTFGVVVRLAGHAAGSTVPVFNDASVWDVYWAPTLEPTDFTIDLARIIPQWQTATGLEMETIDYAQVLFTAQGSVGYVGKFWLDKVTYGDFDYLPFDTAEALTINDRSGVATYTHAFSAAGDYEMTVVGTNTGFKNYSGDGYQTDLADNISASEYDLLRLRRTITIHVTE